MKKVAIVTLYDDINIGNKLQNFALQEILIRQPNINAVITLRYSEARKTAPDNFGWKGKLALLLGFPKTIAKEKKKWKERRKRFNNFSKKYLNTAEEKSFLDFDKKINDEYDYFVVGSDQVWHNWTNTKEELDYFFLRFVDPHKRICVSPSIGLIDIPEKFKTKYIEGLNGFRYLSCREAEGCDLIYSLTNKLAELLPDPTMILTKQDWEEIEKKPDYEVPEHFILCYFLSKNKTEINKSVNDFSKRVNLPIINIYDKNYLQYFTTRPDEFLYLIHRADYVCTNSFHGSVFSILFQKNLLLFRRKDNEGVKMNSRLNTLIEEFDLMENENGIICNYEHTDRLLFEKREKMQSYLQKVFEEK